MLPRLRSALEALGGSGQLIAGEGTLVGELARWQAMASVDIDGAVIPGKAGGPTDSKGSLGLVA